MKPELSTSRRPRPGQRGDALLESLIGMALMAILALGLGNALARSIESQRYVSTQRMAVMKLRNVVATNTSYDTLCTGAPNIEMKLDVGSGSPTVKTVPTTVQCGAAKNFTVGVAGDASYNATVSFKSDMTLQTSTDSNDAKALFGGDGVIQVKQ